MIESLNIWGLILGIVSGGLCTIGFIVKRNSKKALDESNRRINAMQETVDRIMEKLLFEEKLEDAENQIYTEFLTDEEMKL
jgi:hypothetical protein